MFMISHQGFIVILVVVNYFLGDSEVAQQGTEGGVGGGLEEEGVDGEGVVNAEVAEVAGFHMGVVLVALIEGAGGAVLRQVVAAEPEGCRDDGQQGQQHDGGDYELVSFHRLDIIWSTLRTASGP